MKKKFLTYSLKSQSMILGIVCSFLVLHLSAQTNEHARGRVSISGGTLVTDSGTLLRGCYVSTDIAGTLPPRSTISEIKKLGLNAVHLYAESFAGFWTHETYEPGTLHNLVDSLVNWTETDSLYLVLTIGCIDRNGEFEHDFATGFWSFYAPRYANKTHVIYEIHNEPFAWSSPYPDSTITMERDVYNIIRSHAPDTHVLFFSYAVPKNPGDILNDIYRLGEGINWSNASIAIHGYDITPSAMDTTIMILREAGYAVTNTEPCNVMEGSDYVKNLFKNQIRVFEKSHVSYLNFINSEDIIITENFRNLIEAAHISWIPDFGNWPPPGVWDAFYKIEAEEFSSQSGIDSWGGSIRMVSNNDFIAFENVDFGSGAEECEVHAASGGIGGYCEFHIDSLNGLKIGEVYIENTGGWETPVTKFCPITNASGEHPLFLKFTGGQYDLFDIDWFRFNRNSTSLEEYQTGSDRLYPNYPNPFNPSTNIVFSLSQSAHVKINIYNIAGEVIYSVLNKFVESGEHRITFNAGDLPSGVYFCRMVSQGYSKVQKILLIH